MRNRFLAGLSGAFRHSQCDVSVWRVDPVGANPEKERPGRREPPREPPRWAIAARHLTYLFCVWRSFVRTLSPVLRRPCDGPRALLAGYGRSSYILTPHRERLGALPIPFASKTIRPTTLPPRPIPFPPSAHRPFRCVQAIAYALWRAGASRRVLRSGSFESYRYSF